MVSAGEEDLGVKTKECSWENEDLEAVSAVEGFEFAKEADRVLGSVMILGSTSVGKGLERRRGRSWQRSFLLGDFGRAGACDSVGSDSRSSQPNHWKEWDGKDLKGGGDSRVIYSISF